MPSLMARLVLLAPLVFSIVAIVLSALCLFAGHERGVLEDYAIIRLNTSGLGQNLIDIGGGDDAQAEDTTDSEDDDGNFFDDIGDDISDTIDGIQQDIEEGINELSGNIADQLADEIGISEWYSVHVMTFCQGQYQPNATSDGAGLNTTECSDSSPNNRFSLTEILDEQLSLGPLEIGIDDIDLPEEIQDSIDLLNAALLGLFILYVLTMAFSGLSVIGTVVAIIFLNRGVILINMIISALAMLTSAVSSIIVTVVVTEGIDEINAAGEEIGLEGHRGENFLILTWIVTAFMIASTFAYTFQFCTLHRQRRRERKAMRQKEGGY